MCAENRMSMNTDTNEIKRKNVKMENSNKTGVQRLDKRHINEDKFKAFECNEEMYLSTAVIGIMAVLTTLQSQGRHKSCRNSREYLWK